VKLKPGDPSVMRCVKRGLFVPWARRAYGPNNGEWEPGELECGYCGAEQPRPDPPLAVGESREVECWYCTSRLKVTEVGEEPAP